VADDRKPSAASSESEGPTVSGSPSPAEGRASGRLTVGTRLGPYEIVSFLGAGGMGDVYRARDTRLGRIVAIKVLRHDIAENPGRRKRFDREARTISRLSHPHICALFDVGAQDGVEYIVIEYLEGETLAERLTKGPLPFPEAVGCAIEIAEALAEAHRHGIVHRDLKPGNVMLTRSGAKLLDFGIAKLRDDGEEPASALTGTGQMLGTVHYMAPEQVKGTPPPDGRTDIFAFGAVLYEMVTAQKAFAGPTTPSIIAAILEHDPPALGGLGSETSHELKAIVRRCLEKDPARRWQSAHDLLGALCGLPQPRSPSPRRRGSARAAGAALLLLLAAGGPFLLRTRSRPETSAAKSIVVLPFQVLGPPSQDEYFADGVSEAITTELTRMPGLLVIARNSAVAYKGRVADVQQVGRELGVSYVLDGTVQRSVDRLRVYARLADASSGYQLWADQYEGGPQDIFRLQDEIAARAAEAVRPGVTAARRAEAPTANVEAYDFYLRGKFRFRSAAGVGEGSQHVEDAIVLLERATALDPGFALAHAKLGEAYASKFFYRDASNEWEERAYAEIEKALARRPDLAEAHLAKGNLIWTLPNGFPHERAVAEYRTAIRLDPSLADGHLAIARVYEHVGLLDEALRELAVVARLDPTNVSASLRIAYAYLWRNDDARALAQFETTAAGRAHFFKAAALSHLGREAEAFAAIEAIVQRGNPADAVRSVHALLLARRGDRAGAEAVIRELAAAARNERGYSAYHHVQYYVGATYATIGKPELAVEWLRKASEQGFPCYPAYAGDPHLAPLKGHPAFVAFLADLKGQWERRRATL
jgi:eukaryotic-like serine/threonine-protein kinase